MSNLSVFFFLIFLTLSKSQMVLKTTDVRIVGGRPAEDGEFPYQVSIRRSYNNRHFCGGSLISPNHVLTAAHCMFYASGAQLLPSSISIVAGQLNLTLGSASIYKNVSKIIVHPEYDSTTIANDLAIIQLGESVSFSRLVTEVPLNGREIPATTSCVVTGWGVENYTLQVVSEKLLVTEVFIIDFEECNTRYNNIEITLTKGAICANNEEKEADACQGDSGGPLVCQDHLVGVVSAGNGCGDSAFPGIYTDVAYYLSWIKQVANLNNDEMSTLTAVTSTVTMSDSTTITAVTTMSSSPPIIFEIVNNLFFSNSALYILFHWRFLVMMILLSIIVF